MAEQIAGFGSTSHVVPPATGGNEGVGEVVSVGSGVKGVKEGDWVVPSVSGVGTWSTHAVAQASDICVIDKSANLPVEHAATAVVAPALAHCLLQFADLSEGDVIIQNNAGSSVGQVVQQLAAEKGVVVVNVLRDHPQLDDLSSHFEGLNPASVTVTEEVARTPELRKIMSDMPAPKLALDSTGGAMALVVADCLRPGGTMVTYGNMSRKPVVLPMQLLLDRGIVARGFNLDAWARQVGPERRNELVRKLAADAAQGKWRQLLAWEPFADFDLALQRSLRDHERKVVTVMEPSDERLDA